MAVSLQPRGRRALSMFAGSALALSAFAFGAPAAFAETEHDLPVELDEHNGLDPTEVETFDDPSESLYELDEYESDEEFSYDEDAPDLMEDGIEEDAPDLIEDGIEEDDDEDVEVSQNVDISVSTAEVYIGESLELSGTGFTPGWEVAFEFIHDHSGVSVDFGFAVAADVGDAEPGAVYLELTIGEWSELGAHTIVATDPVTGAAATATYTVVENVDEPKLAATPDRIELADFIGEPDQDGIGVVHTVENLEPDESIVYIVTAPDGSRFLDGTGVADSAGIAEFTVRGVDVPNSEEYVGEYRTEVSTYNSLGEEINLETQFQVMPPDGDPADGGDEAADEDLPDSSLDEGAHGLEGATDETLQVDASVVDPSISADRQWVYAGAAVQITGTGFTPHGDVRFELDYDLGTTRANEEGELVAYAAIPSSQAPASYTLTAVDTESGETATIQLEVVAPTAAPTMTVDPERITLSNFVGEPQDGAGVVHRVSGMDPGAELVFLVSGPATINDYQETVTVDSEGTAEFVIHGYEVSNLDVYLGQYTTVVTYRDHHGEQAQLAGAFTVITDDGTPAPVVTGAITPADLGATNLAETGAGLGFFGLLAGGLLLLGGLFVAIAHRRRLRGRRKEA